MSDVKRSSRGGRRKRSPKTESPREAEKADESTNPETVSNESLAEGGSMPEENEVLAAEKTAPLQARAEADRDEAPETGERVRDRDEDEPLDTDAADRDDHYDEDDDDRDLDDEEDDRPPRREEARGHRNDPPARGRSTGGGGHRDNPAPGNRSGGGSDKSRVAPDEYLLQVRYDRNSRQFLGTVGEFPELKVTGNNRDHVVEDLEIRVEDHISTLRRDGRKIPEPVQTRRYPERLELRVSQNLQRRLDLLSRQEKVGLDQLVTELLTQALDRKTESPRQEKQHHGGGHGNRHGNSGNQQRHQQHGGRRAGRNFHETMDNRENFMEYVRNLEKGNLKKR